MNQPRPQHEDDIEAEAARWLARRDAGLSPDQETEFDRWKASDPRHAAAMAEFESMWTEIGRPRRTGVAAAVQQECRTLQRRRRRRHASLAAGACAAILLIGVAIPRWISKESSPAPQTAIVLLPERRTLPDGSIVELKEGAKITVSFDASNSGQRRVVLHSGEAHFQVAKAEDRPFIVAAGDVAVRAVGTAFSVDRSSNRIDVLVTEGTVAVGKPRMKDDQPPMTENTGQDSVSPSASSVLEPPPTEWRLESGNRMVLDDRANSAPELLPVDASELNERFAWRSPRVEFSRASLPEVVGVMNQYSRVQFRIADRELESVKLSGRFRADDAGAFARALERSFGIKAERASETEIILRRA